MLVILRPTEQVPACKDVKTNNILLQKCLEKECQEK